MDQGYHLAGFLNLFGFLPDFVYPIFSKGGHYYFQHGKDDVLERFVEVREDILDEVYWTDSDRGVVITASSLPIYAFQYENEQVEYGNAIYMQNILKKVKTDDKILIKQIREFYEETKDAEIHRLRVIRYARAATKSKSTKLNPAIKSIRNNYKLGIVKNGKICYTSRNSPSLKIYTGKVYGLGLRNIARHKKAKANEGGIIENLLKNET